MPKAKKAKPSKNRRAAAVKSRASKFKDVVAVGRKLKQQKSPRKSKVVLENGEWTIVRNEAFQREFSIHKNGQPAIPSVRFSTKLEAEKVLRALTGEAFKQDDEEPKQAPNRPEFHESVQAVRGQTPRA